MPRPQRTSHDHRQPTKPLYRPASDQRPPLSRRDGKPTPSHPRPSGIPTSTSQPIPIPGLAEEKAARAVQEAKMVTVTIDKTDDQDLARLLALARVLHERKGNTAAVTAIDQARKAVYGNRGFIQALTDAAEELRRQGK